MPILPCSINALAMEIHRARKRGEPPALPAPIRRALERGTLSISDAGARFHGAPHILTDYIFLQHGELRILPEQTYRKEHECQT